MEKAVLEIYEAIKKGQISTTSKVTLIQMETADHLTKIENTQASTSLKLEASGIRLRG